MEMCGCVGCQGVASSRIVSTRNYWFNDQRKHLSKEQAPVLPVLNPDCCEFDGVGDAYNDHSPRRSKVEIGLIVCRIEDGDDCDDDFRWVRGTQTSVFHTWNSENDNLLPNEEETNCLQNLTTRNSKERAWTNHTKILSGTPGSHHAGP